MIVPSSLKQKRVHNNIDLKPKPPNSSLIFSQTSFNSNQRKIEPVGKKALMLNQTPILSFTSFQSYLQDCNQNSFVKKQNERVFRSQQTNKTQQNFNPKKQIHGSSHTKKYRFTTEQDNNQISPFQTDKQITFNHYKQGKSNRKAHSKSQSSNYDLEKSSSFAERFLHQKIGMIDGWSQNEQNINLKNKASFNCTVLKQKSHQNKDRNEVNRKVPSRKPKYDIQSSTGNFSKDILSKSMRKKSTSANKENVSQILPVFIQRQKKNKQNEENQSNPFHKTYKKSFNPINCLTQINELEQQILLSKRQDITNRSSNVLKSINYNEQSNILRLKKQAQYLCDQQEEYRNKESNLHQDKQNIPSKSKSVSIQLGDISNYNNPKVFKPFVKFPSYCQSQLKNINLDTQNVYNKTNSSFQFKQKSSNVLKILQSLSPNQQNALYEPRTPIKLSSNLKNYSKVTGSESDMKNATRNRQSFHNSIKQRKSRSAFNSICRNEKVHQNKKVQKINTSQFINTKNEEQDKLLLTIVNSFHSATNNKLKTKYNKHNLSLNKSIDAFIKKEQNESKRIHTSQSFHHQNEQFNHKTYCKDISEFLIDSHPTNFSLQQNLPLAFCKQQKIRHNLSLNVSLEPFQNLSKLSQDIKKMNKISTPISLSIKYNKKFSNFHKSIKNEKSSLRSSNFCQKDSDIQKLCISQLQARKIHKLKKINEIQE